MSDPVGFFVGAVATAGGAFIAGASFGLASPLSTALISFGIGQMGRSIVGGSRPSHEDMQSNVGSPDATLPVVYGGPVKIGGKVIETWVDHGDVSDHESLWRGVALAVASEDGSGIESFERVWLDEVLAINPVTDDNSDSQTENGVTSFFGSDDRLSYVARTGTDGQTVPTTLNNVDSTRYPTSWRNRGIAYLMLNLWKDDEVYPRLPNVTVEIKGNHVYDPRDSTWKFSRNPALHLLDYLTSAAYGAELNYPERDGGDLSLSEIDEQSFISAANYADEQVQDGSGGTQARFRFDGWLDTGNKLDQNVDALLTAMRGELVHQGGKFRLVIRKQKTPVQTLSEDEIKGNWSFRRAGARKVPNRVVARYAGGTSGDLAEDVEFPDADDDTFLDQDGGHRQSMKMDLVGVQDVVRAEQIAMVALRESREDTAVSVDARASTLELEIGDVVTVDHETPGWTGSDAKDFWVVEMTIRDDETVSLKLKEYADSAYSLDSQTRPTPPPGSALPDPTTTGDPTIDSLTSDKSTQKITPAGDKIPRISASISLPTDKGIDRVVVLERESGTQSWNTAKVVDPVEVRDGPVVFAPESGADGDTWEVGVYLIVGRRGLKSSIVTGQVVLDTDFVASDLIGTIIDVDVEEDDFDSDGVVEGRMLVDVIDSGDYDLEFSTRQGQGTSWTAGSNPTNVSQGDPTETQDVELLEKANSFIRLRVFAAGTTDLVGRPIIITFDPDQVAHVVGIGAWIKDDGTPGVDAGGDSDTAKIYVTYTLDGTEPPDPTATNADGTIKAREGEVEFSAETVSKGGLFRAKARGENGNGQLAPAGTAKRDRQMRPGSGTGVLVTPTPTADPGRVSGPLLQEVTLDAIAGPLGTSQLEVNWKVVEARTGRTVLGWQGWTAAPTTETFTRGARADRELVYKARDVGVPDDPESGQQTLTIESFLDKLDIPALGRGPFEDDQMLKGVAGQTRGREGILARVRSRTGNVDLIDTEAAAVASGLETSPGDPTLLHDRNKLSGQQIIAVDDWELYSYDPDTSVANGVKLGARLVGSGIGSNADDFKMRKGGETLTLPGSEVDADSVTDYWVYWERGASTVSIVPVAGNDLSDVYDWNRIFLPGDNSDLSFTSAFDDSSGDGSPGDDIGGSGGDGTLK